MTFYAIDTRSLDKMRHENKGCDGDRFRLSRSPVKEEIQDIKRRS